MGASEPGQPSGPAGPHVTSGVPVTRQQVHRAADAEVLITARARAGPHRFRCAARWPSGHRTAVGGRHSPLLVAESIRQACLCLAQGYFDVPGDTQFVIKSLAFSIDPGQEPAARGAATDLVMDVDVGDLRLDPATGQLVALTMRAAYRTADDADVFATAAGTARLFTPEQYTAVRAAPALVRPLPPADGPLRRPAPDQVAVARTADFVIAEDADGRWFIAPADPQHPFFFDHPADHLPGMLLLEAARQHALLQWQPASKHTASEPISGSTPPTSPSPTTGSAGPTAGTTASPSPTSPGSAGARPAPWSPASFSSPWPASAPTIRP
nr:AfsA-related hotdog domain-containing protein [Streptomyces sp. 846.5]